MCTKRVTVTDLNVLDLVAQVCLRRQSEEATAEDGSGPARYADHEAAGLGADAGSLSMVVLADAWSSKRYVNKSFIFTASMLKADP